MNYTKLPIYQYRSSIISALEQNQVIIVESPTGSGKTTQLPLILHGSGYTRRGMVGITQPRRIATLSVCDFISQQLQVPVGGFVGYKMRFEDCTHSDTKIKIMTDGTLLQELKHDPLLLRYSVIMIDEAHERSLTIDFILGLLKDILPRRNDFRLLVSSATIRSEVFSQYFYQAPIISIQAESFPVQVIYRPAASDTSNNQNPEQANYSGKKEAPSQKRNKEQKGKKHAEHKPAKRLNPAEEIALQICNLILELVHAANLKTVTRPSFKGKGESKDESQTDSDTKNNGNTLGDILVFLPGEANIKVCLAVLLPYEKKYGLYILPLYARLGKEEQQRIFADAPYSEYIQAPCRKVILATNIAETSLTIEGVTVVIDTGRAKLNHFDSCAQHAELREGSISKASAEQRKGRAGRVAPGRCYRLYSYNEYRTMRPYTQEEIQRTDLTEVVLRMAELGIQKFEQFDFLTPPDPVDIRNAVDTLIQLNALNRENRMLTEIGQQMCYFPLLPRHSRILIEAVRISPRCIHPASIITAFLSSSSPFLWPHGQEEQARQAHSRFMSKYGDFEFYLRIFSYYRKIPVFQEKQQFCEQYFLDQQAMHELERIVEQLKDIIRNSPPFNGIAIPEEEPLNHKNGAFQQQSSQYREDYMQACMVGLQGGICILSEGKRTTQPKNGRRKPMYRSLTTRNIAIHPGSSLFSQFSKYLLAGEIVRTSQTYARTANILEPKWIDHFDPVLRKQLERLVSRENKENKKQ